MNLYNCKVRLHANPLDEVRKKNVTAGEIRVLRQVHGDDSVLEITKTGHKAHGLSPETKDDLRTEAEERDRLERFYGEKAVAALFGGRPQAIDEELQEDKPLPVVKRGRQQAQEVAELA
jgi:hypothetical protein